MRDFESPKEFAERLAGKRIMVSPSACPINNKDDANFLPIPARVIGYIPSDNEIAIKFPILIEFEDEDLKILTMHHPSCKISHFVIPPLDQVFYWQVTMSEVIENIKEKIVPAIIPYPNKCKICKFPARTINKLTLCSNVKCKSRVKFKHSASFYSKKTLALVNSVDCDGYPICQLCQNRAASTTLNRNGSRITICKYKHKWFHQWVEGEKIAWSLAGGSGSRDHIFSGGIFKPLD